MRAIFFFISTIITSQVMADNLCPINEKVEPDVRIPESYFTKERAEQSIARIQQIVSGTDKEYEWITVPNSLKIIEGYVLRRDALNAQGIMTEYYKSQFCTFMQTQAWWYD